MLVDSTTLRLNLILQNNPLDFIRPVGEATSRYSLLTSKLVQRELKLSSAQLNSILPLMSRLQIASMGFTPPGKTPMESFHLHTKTVLRTEAEVAAMVAKELFPVQRKRIAEIEYQHGRIGLYLRPEMIQRFSFTAPQQKKIRQLILEEQRVFSATIPVRVTRDKETGKLTDTNPVNYPAWVSALERSKQLFRKILNPAQSAKLKQLSGKILPKI
jgi:hypothetical protein